MEKEYIEISSKKLRNHIKEEHIIAFKRRFGFNVSLYTRQERLREKVDDILYYFAEGRLKLTEDQYPLFAHYIDTFTVHRKESLFDILQKLTTKDVRHIARMERRPLWQKMLGIDPDDYVFYMSARALQKRVDAYKHNERLEVRRYIDRRYDRTNNKLREEAMVYIDKFLQGKITIKKKDRPSFRRYVMTLSPILKRDNFAAKALAKLNEQRKADKEPKTKSNFSLKTFVAGKLKALQPSSATKQKLKKAGKIAAVAVLLATGVYLLKNCFAQQTSSNDDNTPDKTEIKKTPPQNKDKKQAANIDPFMAQKVAMQPFQTISDIEEKKDSIRASRLIVKNPEVKSVLKTTTTAPTSYRAAIVNHHNHVLKMILGENKKVKLLDDVNALISSNIISLPANMGAEEFAYALTMYEQYGLPCNLKKALESKTKLSAAENQKLVEEIIAAGDTGLGVQKMAIEKSKGKVNHKSHYNKSSKKDQKQHKMNMKQLRQIRAQQARAA